MQALIARIKVTGRRRKHLEMEKMDGSRRRALQAKKEDQIQGRDRPHLAGRSQMEERVAAMVVTVAVRVAGKDQSAQRPTVR